MIVNLECTIAPHIPQQMLGMTSPKLAKYLIENSGNSPPFSNPTLTGLEKMFNTTWIQNTLSRTELIEEPELEITIL